MRELTAASLKNLEAGNTTGAGTKLCGRCGGKKEKSRLNSRSCRACGGKSEVKVEREENLVLLRTWVSIEVRDKIYAIADEQGVSSSAVLRDILTAHTETTDTEAAEDRSIPPLTEKVWEACKAWCRANQALYDSAPVTGDALAYYTWALQNGFKP